MKKSYMIRVKAALTSVLCVFLSALLSGCTDTQNPDVPEPDEPKTEIQLESITIQSRYTTINLEAGGDPMTLGVAIAPPDYPDPVVEWTADSDVVRLEPSANTLECTVYPLAEGSARIVVSCGGKSDSITASVATPAPAPVYEKANYEDYLGDWYVSGTLGVYFQQWHEIGPYDMKYCINVAPDAEGTGYRITRWETPATIKDAQNAYYSCLHKDKNGLWLDDVYSYFGHTGYYYLAGVDMSLDAGYDDEEGYMYLLPQIRYINSRKTETIVLSVSRGEVGSHGFTNPTSGNQIAQFRKLSDGTVSVVSPDGATRATAMGYMNLDPELYYVVAKTIYNNLPDFPLVMTKASGVATGVKINEIIAGTSQISILEEGKTLQATATLAPETADPSHLEWYSTDPAVATVDASGLITAVCTGATDIVAYADGAWSRANVTVVKPAVYNAPSEAVDLGLSVKWAPYNVGATAPEDYGGYYAWAETDIKYYGTYKYAEEGRFDRNGNPSANGPYTSRPTKYLGQEDHLENSDDAARVHWGSGWRMPTKDEINELKEKCTRQNERLNGVDGVRITGPSGNSIFVPYAGYISMAELKSAGQVLILWSDTGFRPYDPTPYQASAYYYSTNSTDVAGGYDASVGVDGRALGASIRPVK